MWKWFKGCNTAEQGKKLYREYAHKFHPDNGGTGEELKEINAEFKQWWSCYKDIHTNADGETYQSTEGTTETAEDFIEIIRNLSGLTGIEVELCGSWLWISGNTYPVKDQLSAFGCRWSKGKKKWYWTKEHFVKSRYKTPSMADIRMRYGSEQVQLNRRAMLA